MIQRLLMIVLCLSLAALTTACGRKAGLLTPYEAGIEAQKEAEKAGEPVPPAPKEPVKDRRFILDGLI